MISAGRSATEQWVRKVGVSWASTGDKERMSVQNTNPPRKRLTVSEAAKLTGYDRVNLQYMIRKGVVKSEIVDGHRYIDAASLFRYMLEHNRASSELMKEVFEHVAAVSE